MITYLASLAGAVVARDDQGGQGLAEYALILSLIAIVSIISLVFLGGAVSGMLSMIGHSI
ncbi:MAG: Flp family type IVb pilin [Chloroflexota bacterium]